MLFSLKISFFTDFAESLHVNHWRAPQFLVDSVARTPSFFLQWRQVRIPPLKIFSLFVPPNVFQSILGKREVSLDGRKSMSWKFFSTLSSF